MGGIGKCRRSFHGLFACAARTRNDLEGRPAALPSDRAGDGDCDVLTTNPRVESVSIVSSRSGRARNLGQERIPAALRLHPLIIFSGLIWHELRTQRGLVIMAAEFPGSDSSIRRRPKQPIRVREPQLHGPMEPSA